MLTAGAADCNNQAVFAFFNIIRDQKLNHVGQLVQEYSGLRKTHHIILHSFIVTGLGLQFLDIIRVWQESYIKDQIGVCGDSMLEPEGHDRYHKTIVFFVLYKNTIQLFLQFSD